VHLSVITAGQNSH